MKRVLLEMNPSIFMAFVSMQRITCSETGGGVFRKLLIVAFYAFKKENKQWWSYVLDKALIYTPFQFSQVS